MITSKHLITWFESVLAASPDAVIISDVQGNIVRASQSAERLFHYSPGYLNGINVSQLMPRPLGKLHDVFLTHYREAGQAGIIDQSRIVTAVDAEAQEFPIHLTVAETVSGDSTWYIAFCLRP
ncbi:MAG TPA: PAS domain-containing protein [Saccharospirillum sp.]|nr:PAS domain-containing protein [Saccharospirillum sp.]